MRTVSLVVAAGYLIKEFIYNAAEAIVAELSIYSTYLRLTFTNYPSSNAFDIRQLLCGTSYFPKYFSFQRLY